MSNEKSETGKPFVENAVVRSDGSMEFTFRGKDGRSAIITFQKQQERGIFSKQPLGDKLGSGKELGMDIIQAFYNNMASQYDKLFLDWHAAAHEQALILNRIFNS